MLSVGGAAAVWRADGRKTLKWSQGGGWERWPGVTWGGGPGASTRSLPKTDDMKEAAKATTEWETFPLRSNNGLNNAEQQDFSRDLMTLKSLLMGGQ